MTITGSCHCGKTAFRIEGDIPAKLTRCTCSFCSKRGALSASDVSGFLFFTDFASPFLGIYVYRASEPATTTLLSLGVIALLLSPLRRTAYSKNTEARVV